MTNKVHTLEFSRRNLPHWIVADHAYFITLRLKGTLPREVVLTLQKERQQLTDTEDDPDSYVQLQRAQFKRIEQILDSVEEKHHFDRPEIAGMMMESMIWLQESRGWRIYAAVVLSTNIHLLVRSKPHHQLLPKK